MTEFTHRCLIIPGSTVRQDNQIAGEARIPLPAFSFRPKHRVFPASLPPLRVNIHANRPANSAGADAVKNDNNPEELDTGEKVAAFLPAAPRLSNRINTMPYAAYSDPTVFVRKCSLLMRSRSPGDISSSEELPESWKMLLFESRSWPNGNFMLILLRLSASSQ